MRALKLLRLPVFRPSRGRIPKILASGRRYADFFDCSKLKTDGRPLLILLFCDIPYPSAHELNPSDDQLMIWHVPSLR